MSVFSIYQKVKGYLHNALWMIGDRVVSLAMGFALVVLIARHLGPEDFGLLAYVTSLTAIFTAAGHMGLSGLVVREIVQRPEDRGLTLGTTLVLKFLGMSLGYGVLLIYGLLYEGLDTPTFLLIALGGLTLFFQVFEILEFWFQAFVKARFAAIARITSVSLGALLKLFLLFAGSAVFYFVLANLIQAILLAVVLLLFYVKKSDLDLRAWQFSKDKAKALFGQGWKVYLGSIFAVIYLKVDQVMLRWFVDEEAVGLYAVAAQLSEAWYFVPAAIVASVFPRLIDLRKADGAAFERRFQQLLDLLCMLGLGVAAFLTLFAQPIVTGFFGDAYRESASVLSVHVWASLFIAMRAAFSRWILIEGALMFSLLTQGVGALMNIALNMFLIPTHGVLGAAFATLVSYAAASFFSLALYKKTRPVFMMMSKAFLTPLRYPYQLIGGAGAS